MGSASTRHQPITLYYVHDPMCAWCFGFKHALTALTLNLPSQVQLVKLIGGLAPDSNDPMPLQVREYIQQNWRRIESIIPDISFNYDFWQRCIPKRSTYPACRAVIAARQQDPLCENKMIEAIQQGYYHQARNPSEPEVLVEFAAEIGLCRDTFAEDLVSNAVNQKLIEEIKQASAMGVSGFPSLVIHANGGFAHLAVDYHNPDAMLAAILAISR